VGTKKISKPVTARDAGRRSAVARPRARAHPLAPEHIGEAGSVAVLAVTILGLSIFIVAIAVIVSGITVGSRYTGDTPPPTLDSIGLSQILGGVGLLVLSVAMVASSLGVLADIRRSRMVAAVVSAVAALLAVAGVVWVMSQPAADQLFAAALAVVAITTAAAAIVLGRPRRRRSI
jgi:hypothetical protein